MQFERAFLRDMNGETVYDRLTRHSRWSVHYERVFKYEGRFFLTTYSRGATESQDESPYEYDGEQIECVEVFPRETVVTVYEPQAAALATATPLQAACDALEFAQGAILDAIGLEDGLDGQAGARVLQIIRAALLANGRTLTPLPDAHTEADHAPVDVALNRLQEQDQPVKNPERWALACKATVELMMRVTRGADLTIEVAEALINFPPPREALSSSSVSTDDQIEAVDVRGSFTLGGPVTTATTKAELLAAVIDRLNASPISEVTIVPRGQKPYEEPASVSTEGWKPIASAPKDGTAVLLHRHGKSVVQGAWNRGGAMHMPHWMTPQSYLFDPTHWHPMIALPAPPPDRQEP